MPEVQYKRPTLRVEREARVLFIEFTELGEKEFADSTEENFLALSELWQKFVKCVCVDPQGLEYGELTRAEMEGVAQGFFAFAREGTISARGNAT